MDAELFIQHEAFRSEIYKHLADCYHVPDDGLPAKRVALVEKLRQVCPRAHQEMSRSGEELQTDNGIEALKVEYARLFVGPYTLPAPPYGSVYLESERRIMGNSTLDVVSRYRQSGLAVADDFKDAPDHIAAELEFMHYLIVNAMGAANEGDANRIVISLLTQQSFLEIHLGAWIHEFARSVAENTETSFYRNLARATEIYIKEDYRILSSAVTSWSYNPEEYNAVN